jgi:sugar/nucleoside kinase (ribokinase family)
MPKGIIGLGMWCVDTTYKINTLPQRGKLEPIIESYKCVGGGPANILTDLCALGFKYPKIAMGSIGIDQNAKIIKKHCKDHSIDIQHLIATKKAPTSHTVCMFEKQKERTFLYYAGANNFLSKRHFQINKLKTIPKILYVGYITLLGELDTFYKKKTYLSDVLLLAKKNKLITIIDLVSNNDPSFQKVVFSALPNTDYLLLNEIEAELLFKKSVLGKDKRLNKKLISEFSKILFSKGIQKAILIHSPRESIYISRTQTIHTISNLLNKKEVLNAVGAGDAFCAAFIYGIHENWDIKKVIKKAHASGSAMMKIDSSSGNLPNINKL